MADLKAAPKMQEHINKKNLKLGVKRLRSSLKQTNIYI